MDKLIVPYHISHKFIIEHKQWIFVYGSDYTEKGIFGQSWSCQHEPNTFSVPTLYKICQSQTDRWFSDDNWKEHKEQIDERISKIPIDGRPIILFRKIGCGHSELNRRAPKLYKYLMDELNKIKYPNQEIDYKGTVYPIYNQPS